MKALILAGGKGTRLYPLTLNKSKCMLPINGTPNIKYIIDSLKESGISDIYVSINDSQKDILNNVKDVKFIIESHKNGKLGSIGGLKYCIDKIGADDLLVIGGDNFFTDLDFSKFPIVKGKATICLYKLNDKSLVKYYGIAEIDNDMIISFQEKPSILEARSDLCSTLIYGLSKEWILNEFPKYKSKNMDTIGSMWNFFVSTGNLIPYIHKGLWSDIGNPKAYIELHKKEISQFINPNSKLINTYTKNSNINCFAEDSEIINSYIGKSKIKNSTIINSIIFDNVEITNSTIINSIIDDNSTISSSKISNYSVVGHSSNIYQSNIDQSLVWPNISFTGNLLRGEIKNG